MNYGWVKTTSMQLINSDTIAGNEIAQSYNNQADYLLRVPHLVEDAQYYIATTVKRIPATVALRELPSTEQDGFKVYTTPADMFQFEDSGLFRMVKCGDDVVPERYKAYRLVGGNQLYIPNSAPNGLILEYFRYPRPLGDNPDENTEMDNVPETHIIIPYYVASHLVMYDDPYRQVALYNEFETRLSRLLEPERMELSSVVDVYGF